MITLKKTRVKGVVYRKNASKVLPSSITLADLLSESIAGLFSRPSRMILTIIGTMIGLASLVATLGLSKTAGNRIIGRFDELAATSVVVSPRVDAVSPYGPLLPWDSGERLQRLNGVVAAGTLTQIDIGNDTVSSAPIRDPKTASTVTASVWALSPDAFRATRAQLQAGRLFDEGHSQRADKVAILGPTAAENLKIDRVNQLPALTIGDDLYLVIGILENIERQPKLLGSVIIPQGTAQEYYHITSPELVMVETEIGAASLIAKQAPIALRPDDKSLLRVASPLEPQRVKDAVQSDLDKLFLLLGGVALLVGAIGIANMTLVSVMERTGEIGLRRALGATKPQIAFQFLLESSLLGLVGGILGASLGTFVVVGVAAFQGWTPVLDAWVPLAAPLVGIIIGLFSGLQPAVKAASLEPVEALRAGT